MKHCPPGQRKIRAAAALALLLALALARAAAGDEVPSKYFCEDIKIPFFSVQPSGGGTRVVRNERPLSLPAEFAMPKPAGTARVFIVGESAAGLLGAVNPYLEGYLAEAFPGKKIELVNCGMPTYESRRILAVFRETLAYSPDLVIVLSGNNEAVWDFCPGLNAEAGRRIRKLKARLAALSRPRADAEVEVSLALHEDRLREMGALAREHGVPALFCTLPVNLRDYAPAGTPPPELEKGVLLAYGKKPAAALEYFSGLGGDPEEPFRLFYSGRALEELGRGAEAMRSYQAAVKYDAAADRCSAERNAMIRAVASEEKECLADLDKAFSKIARGGVTGGREIADGVHWFKELNPLVSAVIGKAARDCAGIKGKSGIPEPGSLAPAAGAAAAGDFSAVFSYACAYARDEAAGTGAAPGGERVVIMLERLCGLDCGRLEKLLLDPAASEKELLASVWSKSLGEDQARWRPALLRSAARMFRRAGRTEEAGRAEAALARAEAAAPAAKTAARTRPLRQGEAAAKELSDQSVKKIQAGDLAGARALLDRAAALDGDSLEERFNACYVAARLKDAAFGEENCGAAISLAAYPPKHAKAGPDEAAQAYYSRAYLRLETGGKGACEDLRGALEKAPAGWSQAAAAGALIKKHCPR